MFGRNNLLKIICEGDLARLRKVVEKKPARLNEWFRWDNARIGGTSSGNALHVAAYFNQPEIIEFLVTEKGMNINQRNQVSSRTPLQYAAENGQYEATQALLELGADLKLKNSHGYTALGLCADPSTKELLSAAYGEEQKQEKSAPQAKDQKQPEKSEPADAAARADGTWKVSPGSSAQIVHQYEAPVGQYKLTDIFNLSAGLLTLIAKDLETGHLAKETKCFGDLSDQTIVDQARAKFAELTGETAPAASAPAPKRDRRFEYTNLNA